MSVTDTSSAAVVSALIKTIRLRQAPEACLYLGYLWNLSNEARTRACRRLLICSAEDNTSIPVMTKVSAWFDTHKSDLNAAVRELLRITGTHNWYETIEGRAYIRSWWEAEKAENPYSDMAEDVLLQTIELAVNPRKVIPALQVFGSITCRRNYSRPRLIDCLRKLSQITGNHSAMCLLTINEKHSQTLWWDTNFLGQCLYTLLAGPIGPQIDIEPDDAQVTALTAKAASQTALPMVPNWCLDGIHVSGTDPRFSGSLKHMAAACCAFERFGRLIPDDEWDSDTILASEAGHK